MSLFDARADVLRIGRHCIERWAHASGGLILQGQRALSDGSTLVTSELRDAFGSLFEARAAHKRRSGKAHVILESCWLPVMLLSLGDRLWSRRQIESLMLHRVVTLYGGSDSHEAEVRCRAGAAVAMGYSLAGTVRGVVLESLEQVGVSAASMQPACAWGWERLAKQRKSRREGWWIWLEQDRSLVTRIDRGHWTTLNSSAPVLRTTEELQRCLEIERIRNGLTEDPGFCSVAGWGAPQAPSSSEACQVRWLTVADAADSGSSSGSAVPSRPERA